MHVAYSSFMCLSVWMSVTTGKIGEKGEPLHATAWIELRRQISVNFLEEQILEQ